MPRPATHARAWLWGPAAVAVAVRLALFVACGVGGAGPSDPTVLQSDAIEYHVLARSLAETGRYRFDAADPMARRWTGRWEPEPLRTPGYPAFVASAYRLAGPRPGVPIALQILLEGLTCWVLAWAFRGALGARGAGVAALAYALHPGVALFSLLLFSEALFAVLTVGGFALLVRALGATHRTGVLAAAGVVFGLATLVRPVLQVLPLVIALVVLVVTWPRWRTALALTAVFAVAFVAPLAPWMARNAARHDAPSLSTSGPFNLLTLYAAPVEAAATGRPVREAEDRLRARAEAAAARDGVRVRSDFDRAPYWSAEAVRTFRTHPVAFVREQVVGVARLFLSTGRLYRDFVVPAPGGSPPAGAGPAAVMAWWTRQPPIHRVLDVWTVAYALIVYPLLALGLVRAWRRRRETSRALGLAAALALMLVVVTGTPGHSRFMAPIVPFWAPFVALGVASLCARRREASGADASSDLARADVVSSTERG